MIGEYIDRGISGTAAENRPEFQRMIADSAKRQFQAILVYQLDRFARNRYDSATYKAKLKKNGVKVLSARENISDDASGVLMEAVLEGMAEYFSAELSQKVKRGMMLTAQKCEFTGSGVPLGYKIVDKKFAIDKETAPVVKRIFEMYLAGNTMAEIIRYLNENGVKTSKDNAYNKNSIRRILTNNRYIGIYKYGDIEITNGVPRIIDDITFEQAQILLEKNKKAPARAKAVEENYILTTKLFCGCCKAAMTGVCGTARNGSIHQYYQCVNNRRKSCKKKTVKKSYIEDLVINETRKILTPKNIDNLSRSIETQCEKERNTDNLKRITKLIRENEKATENLIKALEAGKAVDVISAQIEKRQLEKSDLEAQLAKEKIQTPLLKYDQLKFFFEHFAKGDANDINYRRALVDIFIGRIYLYDDKTTIYCNAQEGQINCPIDELNGSPMGRVVEMRHIQTISRLAPVVAVIATPF